MTEHQRKYISGLTKVRVEKVKLIRLLLEDGHSQASIARKLDISRQSVSRLLNHNKQEARQQLAYAVERGDIIRPSKCSKCGAQGKIQAHHEDYDKPFDVAWLCIVCHGKVHGTEHPHGSFQKYQYQSCRCDDCKKGWAKYMKALRAR